MISLLELNERKARIKARLKQLHDSDSPINLKEWHTLEQELVDVQSMINEWGTRTDCVYRIT